MQGRTDADRREFQWIRPRRMRFKTLGIPRPTRGATPSRSCGQPTAAMLPWGGYKWSFAGDARRSWTGDGGDDALVRLQRGQSPRDPAPGADSRRPDRGSTNAHCGSSAAAPIASRPVTRNAGADIQARSRPGGQNSDHREFGITGRQASGGADKELGPAQAGPFHRPVG